MAAKEPAADGVSVGGLDRFSQRQRITGLDGTNEDATPIAQRDHAQVLLRVARWQIRSLPPRAHSPEMNAPASEVLHDARLPPPDAAGPEPKVPDAGQRTIEVLPAANTSAALSAVSGKLPVACAAQRCWQGAAAGGSPQVGRPAHIPVVEPNDGKTAPGQTFAQLVRPGDHLRRWAHDQHRRRRARIPEPRAPTRCHSRQPGPACEQRQHP